MMPRRHADERGSVLVLALIFLLVLSLAIFALLTFADTGTRTTGGTRLQRAIVYAADGAVQSGIKTLQPFNGADCKTRLDPLSLQLNGQTVTLDCAQTESGTGNDTVMNTPARAILTLSTVTGETGLQDSANNDIKVHGGIFSNSNIVIKNASSLNVTRGDVKARGPCTGTINVTNGAPVCNFVGTDPTGDDPNYSPAMSTVPPVQSVPGCDAAVNVVRLQPGTYDNAAALSNLTNDPKCKGNLIWFLPGNYYFDFKDAAASHTWIVRDNQGAQIVGGEPKGWAYTNPQTRPTVSLPGSCKTEDDVPDNDGVQHGVQFVFGGDSQLSLSNKGQMEICAQPSQDRQQIAVYGLKTDTGGMRGQSGCITLAPYPSTVGSCALLSAQGSGNALYLQGTLYAPRAAIDFQQPNSALLQVFGRGVIARMFLVAIQPSNSFTGASISVPDKGTITIGGNPFNEVLITALIDGKARLRAKVHFENGSSPPLQIVEWTVLR